MAVGIVAGINLGHDQPVERRAAGELVQAGGRLVQGEPGEVREVGQREQAGVEHVDVQVDQVGTGAVLEVGAGLAGPRGRIGPDGRCGDRVKMPADQFGPLPGVQLGWIEPEQHHPLRRHQRESRAEPGQALGSAAEHVRHPHRVCHRRVGPVRRAEVRVAVEVDQPRIARTGQDAERDGAVTAQHQGQPPVRADRRHFARHRLGHRHHPVQVTQPVDRLHRPEWRGRKIAAVLDIQAGLAQAIDQPGSAPCGRSLLLPRIMRARAGRDAEYAHPALRLGLAHRSGKTRFGSCSDSTDGGPMRSLSGSPMTSESLPA